MGEIEEDKASVVQNLKDAGCNEKLIEEYLDYDEKSQHKQQICLLSRYRKKLLECIHVCQRKLDCLDYLIFMLKKK